jgi:hypothetical protein
MAQIRHEPEPLNPEPLNRHEPFTYLADKFGNRYSRPKETRKPNPATSIIDAPEVRFKA